MSLQIKLNETLQALASAENPMPDLNEKTIIPLIDLTLLDRQASPEAIKELAYKGMQNKVASVCVFPNHIAFIPPEIKLKRSIVVNFPAGTDPLVEVLSTIEKTLTSGEIDEVDYVFPYQAYLSGLKHEALTHCHHTFLFCQKHGLLFKVILETGALPTLEIVQEMSQKIIQGGCDFLKTSTGKIPAGATIPAVFAMLSAIKEHKPTCGIKISGGIKTIAQALEYMRLCQYMLNRRLDSHCFRLGTSSLLETLLHQAPSPIDNSY